MQAALDSVVQGSNVESAVGQPDALLLQRACTFASLALQAYNGIGSSSPTSGPAAIPGDQAKRLLDVQEVNQPHSTGQSGQHWMWDVKDIGMVVAFRGTVDVFDALTDLSCRPTELQGLSADDSIMLHSGIYLGTLSCCARIDAVYCKLVSEYSAAQKKLPPLFLTGVSLHIDITYHGRTISPCTAN